MKKLASLLCLCLFLAFGLFSVQAKAEAEAGAEEPAWVSAYGQILDGWKEQIAEDPAEYGIVPELYYLVSQLNQQYKFLQFFENFY